MEAISTEAGVSGKPFDTASYALLMHVAKQGAGQGVGAFVHIPSARISTWATSKATSRIPENKAPIAI